MALDFVGQAALITGGNSGIGLAVAVQPAEGGAHVIISGRDAQRGTFLASGRQATSPAQR